MIDVDLGMLLLRAPVGLLLAGHGVQKLFGWFGGDGPAATGEAFESLGYRHGRAMAVVAGLTEVGAGLGLAAGLLTPLAAAGVIGVMANAAVSAHGRAGLWAQHGGYEYPLVVASVAAGVALHGPGAFSVDGVVGLADGGLGPGLGAIGLGVLSAVAVLATRREVAPR
ncbi:DoxX family protein [Pseudonocardia acaciae]|uniref:DoxX family protein n=1 Tax=Pseudonocardia acaciae TaxID=551276 RepID=UPI000490921D|nr:DoxX family protein [Pseudonocardia acaciae]